MKRKRNLQRSIQRPRAAMHGSKRSELNRGRIKKDVSIVTKCGLQLLIWDESFVFVEGLGGIEGQVVEEAANEIAPPSNPS
jgi:hypothetical protein